MIAEFENITVKAISFEDKEVNDLSTFIMLKNGEAWEKDFAQLLIDLRDDNDYIEVLTSGSTGVAKKIKLKKQHLINSARRTNAYFNITKKSNIVCCLSTKHIAGIMMVVRAFVSGCNIIMVKPQARPLQNIFKQVHFIALTPYQLLHSIEDINEYDNVSTILLGGGPLQYSLKKVIDSLRPDIYHSYGMTETCSHIAICNCKTKEEFIAFESVNLDQTEDGCLIIKDPEISDETIITNDIVEMTGKNRFTVLGRKDNIINTGGIKVHPEKIERILSPFIQNPFIIGSKTDDMLGEKVVLLIESENNPAMEKDISKILSEKLSKYEKPKEIIFTPNFAYTQTQKIDRIQTIKQAFGK